MPALSASISMRVAFTSSHPLPSQTGLLNWDYCVVHQARGDSTAGSLAPLSPTYAGPTAHSPRATAHWQRQS